jgi:hypothetical protein
MAGQLGLILGRVRDLLCTTTIRGESSVLSEIKVVSICSSSVTSIHCRNQECVAFTSMCPTDFHGMALNAVGKL